MMGKMVIVRSRWLVSRELLRRRDCPLASRAELGLGDRKVAVELNQAVIEKTEWDSTELARDDRVEIVHFVGGG